MPGGENFYQFSCFLILRRCVPYTLSTVVGHAHGGQTAVAITTVNTGMTPQELREVAAGYFFLPSRCIAQVVGNQ